ncbi:MAG: ATP-binding cassette domain-containing protein [Candidatus Omnitrophica bacterium]|nr:ATP-binding cassette domain-containing protein [Candidatus Omnitrophota bacterium]
MISGHNLSKTYGEQVLFESADLNIGPGEHIGLVGRNGHGKTTLFRMLTGRESPDTGTINVPKGYRIGYLDQQLSFKCVTVLEEACRGLPVHEKNDTWKAEKILSGLGFAEEDMRLPIKGFSGGFQVRLALAKVLVSAPDLLLLDEPTNFLDIISIRWLESFLKTWRGELMVISHDRGFMDSVVDHILGIHRRRMRKMRGKTRDYYAQIARDEEVYEKHRLNEEKKREQMREHINRFRAKARHARGIQSHIKSLGKMQKRSKLDKVRDLSFSFNASPFGAKTLMKVSGLTFSYGGASPYVIEGLNFSVDKSDKICIAGKNGKGKTTLMRLLAGALSPVNGQIKEHHGVIKAYFEQSNTAALDDSRSVEEELAAASRGVSRTEVRNICGAMMFSGNTALKKVGVLSGGEKCRLMLGKLLLAPSNLLLLDEPTHHLDMQACQSMIDAVSGFDGAALIVTHDEYFLRQVATKIIAFKEKGVVVFPGRYDEFLEQEGWDDADGGSLKADKGLKREKDAREKSPKEARRRRAEARELRAKLLKPLEKKISVLEKAVERSEERRNELNDLLVEASESGDAVSISELSRELSELAGRTDGLYDELEELMKEHEKALSRIADSR